MLASTGELYLKACIANTFLDKILCILQANVFAVRQALVHCISLGQSFHVRVRAFRLTPCVICLTMLSQYATFVTQPREEACMRHHEKSECSLPARAGVLNCPAILPFIMIVFAMGTEKLNETRIKSLSLKKPLHVHVGMEVEKEQKQGIDYATQKKANLIQEEYCTSVPFHH